MLHPNSVARCLVRQAHGVAEEIADERRNPRAPPRHALLLLIPHVSRCEAPCNLYVFKIFRNVRPTPPREI
eukprot:8769470-Alexandrium_andersonii.AAC.1